ncbi:MAG TPA: hypothetical protein VN758_05105 [Solirubrobacterales bacterium]|nr:hypothetical protein [Solirubrobacterales bacterium]
MPSATLDASRNLATLDSTDRVARLARLGTSGRLAQYRAGNLDRAELSVWAARYPEEVPIVNGEVEWIGYKLADLD